jgi:hypothetical protein
VLIAVAYFERMILCLAAPGVYRTKRQSPDSNLVHCIFIDTIALCAVILAWAPLGSLSYPY